MTQPAIYPMRIVLRATQDIKMGHQPSAMICQLLKDAGQRMGFDGLPPGMLPDAVEIGRMHVAKQTCYAFGLTLWGQLPNCEKLFANLLDAIRERGQSGAKNRFGLGGNFELDQWHSLVDLDCPTPKAIPRSWLDCQIAKATELSTLTLRWLSPLCATLPRRLQSNDGSHRFFDASVFPLPDLVMRMVGRLREMGIEESAAIQTSALRDADARFVDPHGLDRLHWIKWQYGGDTSSSSASTRNPRQTDRLRGQLYGVMGRMAIEVRRRELIPALVLSQYTHVGERTNFGLGRFVIEETQACLPQHAPRYLRAARAVELAEIAMNSPVLSQEADRLNVPQAEVRRVAQAITERAFQPKPVEHFILPGNKPRLISVPARAERVAQRAIYEQLYPILDRFLSDSCIAYRRGLGRHNATQWLKQSYREGWRWALRSDFHQFFDSIDHQLLRDKLEVFVQDDAMVDLIMKWVVAGAPFPGRGLPTGAVISPLIANLFLQGFDEAVHQDGGRLIRYGDDFVLLFRDPSLGRTVQQRATDLAEQLRLHLNQEKTRLVQLQETPFDFLGYRFFSEKGWQFHGNGLTQIEDLNWHETKSIRQLATSTPLPGESGIEPSRAGIWIVGPGIDWIGIDGADVVCRSRSLGTEDRFQRRRTSELIVLGPATLDHSLLRDRDDDTSLQILVADDVGRWTCALAEPLPMESAEVVKAQVALADDERRCLEFARLVIAAKLRNFATIATAYPARNNLRQLPTKLRSLADQAGQAESLQQLLGIEGAGAAAWYSELEQRIDRKYQFQSRVHPRATDPVNIMLNVAHTLLYRLICLAIIREGFAPSIGFMHQPSPGHAALASDIQELFRHLMERVVIESTYAIHPSEFHATGKGDFDVRMEAGAYRSLVAAVMKVLSTGCTMKTQAAPRSYRQQIVAVVRSLRRHLQNADTPFKVFEHIL